jgi:hypothetical protein
MALLVQVVKQENANTVTCRCLPREHRDRFKDGAHHASLQENERRTMRPGQVKARSHLQSYLTQKFSVAVGEFVAKYQFQSLTWIVEQRTAHFR